MENEVCLNYRWLLSIDDEVIYMIKNVKINHISKKIYAQLFEGMFENKTTFEWVSKISSEKILSLTTCNDRGEDIYTINFHEPKLIKHKCSFNYDSSDIAIRNIIISYKKDEIDLEKRYKGNP